MNDFLVQLAEILEINSVVESDVLASFSTWDSLANLSVIALAEDEYGVSLSTKEISNSKTVRDLFDLIVLKRSKNV